MTEQERSSRIFHVSFVTIIGNVILTVVKFVAGIWGHSAAMISDALHSASDIFSTLIVMLGAKFAAQEKDEAHPYGHERMESVAAVVLAAILFATGLTVGYGGIQRILSRDFITPTSVALWAAALSIVSKEWMYRYTRTTANQIDSPSLLADAWHHRSDALSSIGALLGIGGAMAGFPVLDSVASVSIAVLIGKVAWDILVQGFDQMLDHACPPEVVEEMRQTVLSQAGVLSLDGLTTREFGARCYVDVSIGADETLTIAQGHAIAQRVHDAIEEGFPRVKHCMVHVNPHLPV